MQNDNIKDFLEEETQREQSEDTQVRSDIQAPAPVTRQDDEPLFKREEKEGEVGRHSIKKCPCEKCQEKRKALAIQYGLLSPQEVSAETFEWLDENICGEILTSVHTFKQMSLEMKDSRLAKAWQVAEETKKKMGQAGHAILNKYLNQATFKYKEEIILFAWLSIDMGLRLAHEKQLLILIENEKIQSK